jgi:TRAP-type uncharacterized transport system substrate-binding protein
MKKLILASILALSTSAFAAPAADAPPADCDGVKIATGPKGKGYSNMFADIKKIVGNKVQVCEVNTTGGLDNLNALSTKEADMGLVQVDTWKTMKAGDDNVAQLQSVLVLNNNFLHVVTSAAGFGVQGEKKFGGLMKGDVKQVVINGFSDLRGQRVAAVGSAQLLVRQLDKQLGFGMQVVDVKDDNAAFEMVKNGQAAAALTVSGWPSGTVKALTQQSGLTLVPFNVSVGDPYKVKPLNYKNLAVYNNNSLAIQNVLVTRPFTGQRAANVALVQSAIIQNLSELKEGNYQPGWNEVNVSTTVPEMTSFKNKK